MQLWVSSPRGSPLETLFLWPMSKVCLSTVQVKGEKKGYLKLIALLHMRGNQQVVPVSLQEKDAEVLDKLDDVVAGVLQFHEREREQCSLHSRR